MRLFGVAVLATATACILASCSDPTESIAPASFTTLEPGTLSVCMYPGFAPFESQTADGSWHGYEVEYLQDFAAANELSLRIVTVRQFNDIWVRPGQNLCDVAASGIAKLPNRVAQTGTAGEWSDSYYRVMRSFAVRKGSTLVDVDDLANQTVIVTKGSTADVDLTSRIARARVKNVTIEYTDDEVEAAGRVSRPGGSGQPFAYGGGLGSVETLTQRFGNLDVAWVHCMMLPNGQITSENFSYIVRTASQGLLPALNAWISNQPYPGGPGNTEPCSK